MGAGWGVALVRNREAERAVHPGRVRLVRLPQADAIAERFVRTVRSECLDWLVTVNGRYLERVLRVFVEHYHRERPHRALDLRPPEPVEEDESSPIDRRNRLGGLVQEYY